MNEWKKEQMKQWLNLRDETSSYSACQDESSSCLLLPFFQKKWNLGELLDKIWTSLVHMQKCKFSHRKDFMV